MPVRVHTWWAMRCAIVSVTHEIYKSFNYNPPADMREIFLGISKGFVKVWHEGLMLKLKSNGIDGDLLKFLINYLKDRKQSRIILNGQAFFWKNILAGFTEGSVLSPILFLININDFALLLSLTII